jgi:hypothetical protein
MSNPNRHRQDCRRSCNSEKFIYLADYVYDRLYEVESYGSTSPPPTALLSTNTDLCMNDLIYTLIQTLIAVTTLASLVALSTTVTGTLLLLCATVLFSVTTFSVITAHKAHQQTPRSNPSHVGDVTGEYTRSD